MLESITVAQIYRGFEVLQAFHKRCQNEILPFQISYPLGKNRILFASEVESLNIERNKMIDLYAEKDEEGKIVMLSPTEVKIKEEMKLECDTAFMNFMNKKIDLNIQPILVEDIYAHKGIKFTLTEIAALQFMFVSDEE